MKIGPRKPSIKRSVKARTTGKIKRQVKSAVNPTYGKKGKGLLTDPKKSVYNKVYNKTTYSPVNLDGDATSKNEADQPAKLPIKKTFIAGLVFAIAAIIVFFTTEGIDFGRILLTAVLAVIAAILFMVR